MKKLLLITGIMLAGAAVMAKVTIVSGHVIYPEKVAAYRLAFYLEKMLEKLDGKDKNCEYTIFVNEKALSKAKGQQKRNEKALKNQGFCCTIKGNKNLEEFEVKVVENK